MAGSRMEVNISRLLVQCEKMAAADEWDSNWRYEQYVKALQSQYDTLKASPSAPSIEKLNEFKRRIEHLQSFLPPDPVTCAAPSEPLARPAAGPLSSPVITVSGHGGDVLAELRHRRSGRQQTEARAQLLGPAASDSSAQAAGSVEDDFEIVMKRHHQMQEKAAEEMLALTRNLKEQSLIAKNVISKDKETLERSTALTEKSTGRLQVESQRLAEFSARACRCWLWMMLAVVCVTFMGMVMFMRLFGKKVLSVPPPPPPPSPAPAVSPASAPAGPETGSEAGLLCSGLGWLLPLCDDS